MKDKINFSNLPGYIDKQLKVFICTEYCILEEELLLKRRFPELVEPRQIYFYILQIVFKCNHQSIEDALKFDRATVYHSIEKVRNLYDVYPSYATRLERILDHAKLLQRVMDKEYIKRTHIPVNSPPRIARIGRRRKSVITNYQY